ncbi:MAG: sugar phosphate nucleotidyltransferase [Calditrichota bacterium]
MKIIIPAAGYGSRLRPHTYLTPKALLPVAGKPILHHIIRRAQDWGGDRFTIVCGSLGEKIEAFVRSQFDLEVDFRQQDQPLGLGQAVRLAIDPDDREVLIILGDTILEADLKPFLSTGITTLGVKSVADPSKVGVVVMDNGRVVRLVEKPTEPVSNLAIVGVYFIRDAQLLARAIDMIVERGIQVKNQYQITDALQLMLDWGETMKVVPIEGWFDCGRPDTLLETNRHLLSQDGGEILEPECIDSVIIPPVHISPRCKLKRSIVGPYVSMGELCQLNNVIIRDSILGDRVIIEEIILEKTLIGSRAEVRQQFRQINLGSSSWIRL